MVEATDVEADIVGAAVDGDIGDEGLATLEAASWCRGCWGSSGSGWTLEAGSGASPSSDPSMAFCSGVPGCCSTAAASS